jgi:hypothetical protein
MNETTGYIYDVFFSYTRSHPAGTWVKDHLLGDFMGYLAEELIRQPKVFFDQYEIQTGENWEEKILWGLKMSKVLVAVCSARYFYDSLYCLVEWYTFGEQIIEGIKVNRPRVPIRYNDGQYFPPEVQKTQQVDFSSSNYIVDAFYKNDTRAIVYEENVKKLAQGVVHAISIAPSFNPNFPVVQPPDVPKRPLPQPLL